MGGSIVVYHPDWLASLRRLPAYQGAGVGEHLQAGGIREMLVHTCHSCRYSFARFI